MTNPGTGDRHEPTDPAMASDPAMFAHADRETRTAS